MRFIVVDTADARGSVALFENAGPVTVEAHATNEDYSSWLLPAVQSVLAPVGLSVSQLDGYAVCAGPGSFTGLRVGLTTVKAWAEIYEKPIVAVSRLEALLEPNPGESAIVEPFAAAYFDARRGQIFAALYRRGDSGFTLTGEEAVIAPGDFLQCVNAEAAGYGVRWRSPDSEVMKALPEWSQFAGHQHVIEEVAAPFAVRLGSLAYRKFRSGDTTDALSLDANYVRRSDAEVLWKGNKSPLIR
jgi:tRNA threonylcarbamoyladenosine biosynthesis protein TsaB